MKTKVYRQPESIKTPQIVHPFNAAEYNKACDEYVKSVQDWAKQNGKGAEAGKLIRFQVADGYACYVVVSLRPVTLIHLDHVDGYNYRHIERLTAADIRQEIRAQEALEALFARKD